MCFHVCMCVVLFMWVCIRVRLYVCMYIHVLRMYTCLCVYIHIYVSVCTRVGAPVCTGYVGVHAPIVFVRIFVLSLFARHQEAASYTA